MRAHRRPIALAVLSLSLAGARPAAGRTVEPGGGVAPASVRTVEVRVTRGGFQPWAVQLELGVPVDLVFTREVEGTCATAVVSEELGVAAALPLDRQVRVRVVPRHRGVFPVQCPSGRFLLAVKVE